MKDTFRSILAILLALAVALFLVKETSDTYKSWSEIFIFLGTFVGFALSIYVFYAMFSLFLSLFDKKAAIIRRLERKLPKSTKFERVGDVVLAIWFDKKKSNVYRFDHANKTARFSVSREEVTFSGSLKEGLERIDKL